jgi:hypothetical protein
VDRTLEERIERLEARLEELEARLARHLDEEEGADAGVRPTPRRLPDAVEGTAPIPAPPGDEPPPGEGY